MSEEGEVGAAGAPPRRGRLLRAALVVSLAVNLLFAGLVAGALWANWHKWGWSGRHYGFDGAVERLMPKLPEERRQFAEDVVARYREQVQPLKDALQTARAAAADALVAEPYDEARLRAALETVRNQRLAIRTATAELALDLVRTLDVEERRLFLRYLKDKRRYAKTRGGTD